jgi:hypothetical protein
MRLYLDRDIHITLQGLLHREVHRLCNNRNKYVGEQKNRVHEHSGKLSAAAGIVYAGPVAQDKMSGPAGLTKVR